MNNLEGTPQGNIPCSPSPAQLLATNPLDMNNLWAHPVQQDLNGLSINPMSSPTNVPLQPMHFVNGQPVMFPSAIPTTNFPQTASAQQLLNMPPSPYDTQQQFWTHPQNFIQQPPITFVPSYPNQFYQSPPGVSPFTPNVQSNIFGTSQPSQAYPSQTPNGYSTNFQSTFARKNSDEFCPWNPSKRRSSSDEESDDETQPPTKQCITEDRMMAQLHRLSLESTGQVWEPTEDGQLDNLDEDEQVEEIDADDTRQTQSSVVIKSIDLDDEDSSDRQQFHLSDEVKQMLEHEDIMQRLAKEELLKPSKAVVLWEPPMGSVASNITDRYHYDSFCTNSVIIEELPDDADDTLLEVDTEQPVTDIEIQDAMDEEMDL